MSVSAPARKVCLYLLLISGLAASVCFVNHIWSFATVAGFSAAPAYAYFIWRRERALDERERQFDEQDRQAHEKG